VNPWVLKYPDLSCQDGAILVDDGTPGQRGVYGWIPGQPSRIYYDVCVVGPTLATQSRPP
jgi:hypothetical protein